METIIRDIVHRREKNKPFIIGIDGLGGAGKTTYAKCLQHALISKGMKVVLLHMDDFIHPKRIRYNHEKADWHCYYHLQWRYDYILKNILKPIQLGEEIHCTVEIYDKFQDNYFQKQLDIDNQTILIIEGVFIQRPLLRDYFHYVIYLHVSKEKRLKRVLKRDTYIGDWSMILEKYENRYFPAEDIYVSQCCPDEKADYVVGKV